VQAALKDRVTDNVDEYRELTMARLEGLLAAQWEQATERGDTTAAKLVLNVITQQIRLLGLEFKAGDASGTTRSVVIGGTSEEYVAAMKALATHGSGATHGEGTHEGNTEGGLQRCRKSVRRALKARRTPGAGLRSVTCGRSSPGGGC
jgi:hypothetical protein